MLIFVTILLLITNANWVSKFSVDLDTQQPSVNSGIEINHGMLGDNYYWIRVDNTSCGNVNSYGNVFDFKLCKNLGGMDYTIADDTIKIHYLYGETIISNLLKYLENIAKKMDVTRLILDVHINLETYTKYYKSHGFINTGVICSDNPYWVETVKYIS
jgi:hypothetical protein